jgi:hypothetical protein
MFGLEALVGPLLVKLIGALVLAAGALGVYLKIRHRGVVAERERQTHARAVEQQQAQQRVDQARAGDAEIDEATRARLAEIRRKGAKLAARRKPDDMAPGSRFKFALAGAVLSGALLTACASVVEVPPVRVELPSRPMLPDCPAAPHPDGRVVELDGGQRGVVLALPDALAVRQYLEAAPACWASREVLWTGHVEKLEGRLRAVAP